MPKVQNVTHSTALGPSDLLRRAARAEPERLALVDGGSRYSFADFDRRVSAAALALLDAGLSAGDRVALQLGTGADFAVLFLGTLRAGMVAVPVNPSYTAPEVDWLVSD
ncbi:MAG: fatty-acyl-CoA synthase, partial [Pseudonocardiales bacterium]|nr:fatty-acyl-CoA synthase [Pseudonocardiales bacterium]